MITRHNRTITSKKQIYKMPTEQIGGHLFVLDKYEGKK